MTAYLVLLQLLSQLPPVTGPPKPSPHTAGPGGLEGWTMNYTFVQAPDDPRPLQLVIARHRRVIRRISGRPMVWQWRFRPGGRQVAVEAGPLHSGMMCLLIDIASGKVIDHRDCFYPVTPSTPEWVQALQADEQPRHP